MIEFPVDIASFKLYFLREAGCDYVQGYYYDKPLSKDDFEARLITKKYDKGQ